MFEHPLLAFDTCGEVGTVALLDLKHDATTVTCMSQAELPGRTASARLMPAIDEMLRTAALDVRALRTLVVVHGPGSFTGIRVGLSTAKGLAHAGGVPIVAISRLAVLASLTTGQKGFLAVLDAGRNEFYARRAGREWLASLAEITAEADAGTPLLVAGEKVEAALSALRPRRVGPLDASAA